MTYCDTCGGPHDHNHTLGRLRWALELRGEPTSIGAWVRLRWNDFVLHGLLNRGRQRCQDCGHTYSAWRAGDDEWNRVMGGPWGILCPTCFHHRLTRTRITCAGPGLGAETPSPDRRLASLGSVVLGTDNIPQTIPIGPDSTRDRLPDGR